MADDKMKKIVESAMSDKGVYEEMAQREAEVWSSRHVNPRLQSVIQRDKEAGTKLASKPPAIKLEKVLPKFGITPERGLSLGCGSGRAERGYLKNGICKSFHGIDIAPDAVAEAARLAKDEGLDCTYETQDLNFLVLPENAFDLVVAQTSLHHCLHLEHVIEQIVRCLRPGGVLFVHDYVGESQFQFSDKRLKIMNDILAILPDRLKFSHLANKVVKRINRQEPGKLVSPFESIRSGEIKGILLQHFDVIEKHERTTFMHRVAGKGMRENFTESEDTRAMYALLVYFDQLLGEEGVLPPIAGQYLMRPKAK